MKTTITLLFAAVFTANYLHAQNIFPVTGSVGIGTTSPNASSILEINSTNQGFLPPRMTQTQRLAIVSPATGLLVYQTNGTTGLYYYNGAAWNTVAPASANAKLSNLLAPVAVNQALLPKANGILDLGSALLNWRNIYLSGSLYQDSTRIFNVNNGNTAVGSKSLFSNTGNGNTATGYYSLYKNTGGSLNTANGFMALTNNTTGNSNTASGMAALGFNTSGSFNTATGDSSLAYNTTGVNNTASGKNALYSNINGERNTANGSRSLFSNTNGSWNVADGAEALYANTNGYFNTATGFYALNKNTTGHRNTSSGSYSMYNNTNGYQNAAFGVDALNANTTGSNNTASGFEALRSNTSGYSNVAVGKGSLYSNNVKSNLVAVGDSALYNNGIGASAIYESTANTAVGSKSLFNNTTGNGNSATGFQAMYANTNGSYNTASGIYSLESNTTGSFNTANGFQALPSNTTGSGNTASGINALLLNTTGSGNSAFGDVALQSNTMGNNNTAVGYNADVSSNNLSNATAVGSNAKATANNQVMLGSTTLMSVMAAGSYVIYSDGRFKKNIKENVPGLDFIKQLRPVTYNYDIHKLNDYIKPGDAVSQQAKESDQIKKIAEAGVANKEKKLYTGFVAQEVEKIADKLGFDFSGVYKPQNDKDPYGLSYADFVVPLVKAVQELSKTNDEKDAKMEALQRQNEGLEKRIEKLEAMMKGQSSSANNNTQTVKLSNGSSLEQNIPNPFNNTTIVNYTLPQHYSRAKVVITDITGKTMKEINISGAGKGSIKIDASLLSAGAYSYSLFVNNNLVESKQMVLAR